MNILATYRTHKTVEDMEKTVNEHIQNKRITGSVKKVLICIKEYSKLNPGACKLKAETIAEKTHTSRSTVMRALKKLTDLKVIQKENCTKLNGIKGASIYIILPSSDTSGVTHRDTSGESHEINVCEPKNDAEYINSFNLFKTSTLKEIYINAYAHEEFLNDWQKSLLELLNSFKLDETLGEELHKVIAATEIKDAKDFHIAKDIIFNIAKDIRSGRLTVNTTLRAIYKGAYNEKMKREPLPQVQTVEQENTYVKVPFYNWLDEREVTH